MTSRQIDRLLEEKPDTAIEKHVARFNRSQMFQAITARPAQMARYGGDYIPEDLMWMILKRCPGDALFYLFPRLTRSQKRTAFKTAPTGYVFYHFLNKIPKDIFEELIGRDPKSAAWGATDRMTPAQFEQAVQYHPAEIMENCTRELTPDQFDRCVRRAPKDAVIHHPEKLNKEQMEICSKEAPVQALFHIAHRVTEEELFNLLRRTETEKPGFILERLAENPKSKLQEVLSSHLDRLKTEFYEIEKTVRYNLSRSI